LTNASSEKCVLRDKFSIAAMPARTKSRLIVSPHKLAMVVEEINDPMPMTLEFTGMLDGDEIVGTAKLEKFGNSSFSGIRS
jgi:hypothetical protein